MKKPTDREYSKRTLNQMIVLWFIGAAFGAVVIVVELIATLMGVDGYAAAITIHLPELLAYIGAPITGGVVGYLIKSALENREKIKKNGPAEYDPGDTEAEFMEENYRE